MIFRISSKDYQALVVRINKLVDLKCIVETCFVKQIEYMKILFSNNKYQIENCKMQVI